MPVNVDEPPKCILLRVKVLVKVTVRYPVIVVEFVIVLPRVNVMSVVLLSVSVRVLVDVFGSVSLGVKDDVRVAD